MTLSAQVEFTSFGTGYLEDKSCTTMTWFDVGTGPKRSTATVSQFFVRLYVIVMVLFYVSKYCTVDTFVKCC